MANKPKQIGTNQRGRLAFNFAWKSNVVVTAIIADNKYTNGNRDGLIHSKNNEFRTGFTK